MNNLFCEISAKKYLRERLNCQLPLKIIAEIAGLELKEINRYFLNDRDYFLKIVRYSRAEYESILPKKEIKKFIL